MIRSKVFYRHGALVTALLIVVLSSGGCGKKAENLGRLIADAKQERDKGNNNAAIIHLKNLLQKSPEHAEARYLLGVTYNDTGDFASAEKELHRALDLQYDRAKVIPPLGKALLMTGQFQKVLDQVRLEGDPGNQVQAEVLTLRALASIGLGHGREAGELLEQALARQPEFADALLGQARLAASEKDGDVIETGDLLEPDGKTIPWRQRIAWHDANRIEIQIDEQDEKAREWKTLITVQYTRVEHDAELESLGYKTQPAK